MRKDPPTFHARSSAHLGRGAQLMGYAALAAAMALIVALLFDRHRARLSAEQALTTDFGIEEFVDLVAEPAVPSLDAFASPKRRPVARVDGDATGRR